MTTYDKHRSVLTQGKKPTLWDDVRSWFGQNTWDTTLPDVGPQVQQGLLNLAKDMTPVQGPYRSAGRAGEEFDNAVRQAKSGDYPGALASGIWSGLEATDAVLPAIPLLGFAGEIATSPIDVARSIKNAGKKKKKVKNKSVAKTFEGVDNYDEAMKIAQRGDHLKRDKTGKYIGAPFDETGNYRSVTSPQGLSSMRKEVDKQVEEGIFNYDWYDRARDTALKIAPNSPIMQKLFSRGTASYSPQATPPMEMENFIRQHNARVISGEKIRPRTQSQADKLDEIYTTDPITGKVTYKPDDLKLGEKTGPYADAKDPTISDDDLYKTANDIWHGRVFGYSGQSGTQFDRGFTPQEHGFLTGENLLASDRATKTLNTALPMTPRRMQASTWGAVRLRQLIDEGRERVANATKKQKDWDKDKRPKTSKKDGGKGSRPTIPKMPTVDQLIAKASAGFDQAMPRLKANETYEYITGENVGHLAGLNKLPEGVRKDYSEQMQGAIGNRDPYYEGFQMFQDDVIPIQGQYMNSAGVMEKNPGFSARPLTGLTPSKLGGFNKKGEPKLGGPEMDSTSQEALDFTATVRSILNAQEAGGYHKFTPATSSMKGFEKTGGRIEAEGETLSRIHQKLSDEGIDVVNVGDAIQFGKFDDSIDGTDIQKIVKNVLKKEGGDFTYTPGRFESGYRPTMFSEEGAGTATKNLVSELEKPGLLNIGKRLDSTKLRSALLKQNKIDQEFSEKYNLPLRKDLIKLRRLIADRGFENLPAEVKKLAYQGLPVLLPGGLALSAYESQD